MSESNTAAGTTPVPALSNSEAEVLSRERAELVEQLRVNDVSLARTKSLINSQRQSSGAAQQSLIDDLEALERERGRLSIRAAELRVLLAPYKLSKAKVAVDRYEELRGRVAKLAQQFHERSTDKSVPPQLQHEARRCLKLLQTCLNPDTTSDTQKA